MKPARRRFLQIVTGAVAAPAISRFAMAESYPVRPVHLVVPVPPAGTFDIVGRLIAAPLSQRLGQQVVVDNRVGVATAIGTGFVAHAMADGYTLLLAGSPAAINETLYSNLDFSFTRDIAPVASIERAPLIMVVNSSLPVKNVQEFISYAKANRRIDMGSGGIGSTGDVAGELFKLMAGLKMTHVPYRGEAPAVTDLIAGQIQVLFSTPGSVVSFIKAGTLRALAVTSTGRMDVLPEVPPIAETVSGYEAVSWAGLAAPAGTPRDIIDKLNKETNAVLGDKKLQEQLAEFGAVVMMGSPEDFQKFIGSEIEKWGKVVKLADMKPR
ncbi:MAG: tripartite tricarboxylate transporter substrate binding protein [Xanthobacteraceae bacterium]|jgi:tripartite-type tricarboxylate transporter receptor subunit TctC